MKTPYETEWVICTSKTLYVEKTVIRVLRYTKVFGVGL